jgi:hypothetical protein
MSSVAAHEQQGNKEHTKILHNIQKAKEMKKLFAKIQYLCTLERNTGISSIQVAPDPT